MALEIGDRAPDFTLPSTQGEITLAQQLEKGSVLLVFYPGDDTPVCTRQLCDYRDNLAVFGDLGVQVLGINPQSLSSHERFATKHDLPFPLMSDSDKATCRAYGAIGFLGMTKRALVLIGPDGRVRWQRSDLPIFHRSAAELRDAISDLGD
jgi:peroxiredoxin